MKRKQIDFMILSLGLVAALASPLTAYASHRDWGGPGYEDEEYLHDYYNNPGYGYAPSYSYPGYSVPNFGHSGTQAGGSTPVSAPGSGSPLSTAAGSWASDSTGYRYLYTNGGWPFQCWQQIGNSWYYFNEQGYLCVGWFSVGTDRFFSDPQTGAMQTGWRLIDQYWYYFTNSGALQKGWQLIGGAWYYLDPNTGALWTNCFTPDGYFVNGSGVRLY